MYQVLLIVEMKLLILLVWTTRINHFVEAELCMLIQAEKTLLVYIRYWYSYVVQV